MNSKHNIQQTEHTWVNGVPCGELAVSDRGLLYGDAFFTTIKVTDRRVEHWALHSERLVFSTERLGFPSLDLKTIKAELLAFVKEQSAVSQSADGVVRLTISRGSGVRGYKVPASPELQRIMSWSAIKAANAYDAGVHLSICSTPPMIHPALAGVKHCNRLAEVLAAQEVPQDCFDGIMSLDDKVICGTKSNIYFYINEQWKTPKLSQAGVNGTVRRWLLNEQSNFVEADISHKDMASASYCLVSNAIVGIIPVVVVGSTKFELYPDWQELAQSYRQAAFRE
ncbi:aminodeoxychorismate lyase [Kangiella koreensis]|uniref:Aminodeoxychorismate lyase n=1 Tax=Kangiella koreensis (strain DSM 16069 / JCM 12317 / KCTC 12182 / SW-125) TaxID=523791 RepID=C7RBG8_KANKD|nr:aminodeoxychorismate lyase [Kangiella koreensis]ACV26610.1 aminodeoxychorismate lyase [Kangiella koreensis DSM 16069]